MRAYPIHPDFKSLEKTKLPFYPFLLPLLNKLVARKNSRITLPANLKMTKKTISGYNGDEITIHIYEPTDVETKNCLVYFHGGAFAIKEAPYHLNLCFDYALQTPCKLVFVDYRLLPKYTFPFGLEDGYAATKWVFDHLKELDIKKDRIAVGGDSAGAAIAAGVTLLARDRAEMEIAFQLLIYPVMDKKQQTASMQTYTDTPMWNSVLNKKMWKLYLKDTASDANYASPIDADSHHNLPSAYIEVAEFDCLRDEGIHYAEALRNEQIDVILNKTEARCTVTTWWNQARLS
ncbi:lipase [Bacillus sp. JCM 19045]|nr:lipase [Bacillus sp. JCM 19045]